MLEIVAPLPGVCLSHVTNLPFTQDSQYSGDLASIHRAGVPPRPAPPSVVTLPICSLWTSPWTSLNHQQHHGMTVYEAGMYSDKVSVCLERRVPTYR